MLHGSDSSVEGYKIQTRMFEYREVGLESTLCPHHIQSAVYFRSIPPCGFRGGNATGSLLEWGNGVALGPMEFPEIVRPRMRAALCTQTTPKLPPFPTLADGDWQCSVGPIRRGLACSAALIHPPPPI